MNDLPKPEISLDAQESTNPFICLDGAVCRSLDLKEVHTYLLLPRDPTERKKEHLALGGVSSNYCGDYFKGPES